MPSSRRSFSPATPRRRSLSAIVACRRSKRRVGSRAYRIFEELRIQALLALGRFHDVCSAVEAALSVVAPLGWRTLAWRLQASRAAALDELGDDRAAAERRKAVELLTSVAATLRDAAMRSRFLSQRLAASLLQ